MGRKLVLIVLSLLMIAAACGTRVHARPVPARIVSLAPSITETLFLLGLGDRVVGVTRYCGYPPEAGTRPRIGGYYDPSYEAVIALEPDLVLMLPEHEGPRRNLEKLGPAILVVDHKSISGILDSITAIGRECGKEREAAAVVSDLRARMERIRRKTLGLPRTRVMISVGRNMGSGTVNDVYIAGGTGFYNSLIELAGGVNAYGGAGAYPAVSGEGILRINPEVIIDMVPATGKKSPDEETIRKEWKAVSRVDAVRNNRVHIFGQDYVTVPGPRFILLLEEMARVIHPEANWK